MTELEQKQVFKEELESSGDAGSTLIGTQIPLRDSLTGEGYSHLSSPLRFINKIYFLDFLF